MSNLFPVSVRRFFTCSSSAFILAAALVGVSCGGGSGSGEIGFEQALPDMQMLVMAMSEEQVAGGYGLALVADQSKVKAKAKALMGALDQLVADTVGALKEVMHAAPPLDVEIGGRPCRRWKAPSKDGKVMWSLSVCKVPGHGGWHTFWLSGRKLAQDGPAGPPRIVLGGRGRSLPSFNGEKRGEGQIGLNLDALAELVGGDYGGKLGMAYRSAGLARQLVVGLEDVRPKAANLWLSGTFRFVQVIGKGGLFTFSSPGDFLGVDAAGKLVPGRDGVLEFGRARVVWNGKGAARAIMVACGGTVEKVVGFHGCVSLLQCWDLKGTVGFEDVEQVPHPSPPHWKPARCPDVPFPADEPPPDSDLAPPEQSQSDTQAPVDSPPSPIPEEQP